MCIRAALSLEHGMNIHSLQIPRKDETLYWALALSILLHVMIALTLTSMHLNQAKLEHARSENRMTVELVAAQPSHEPAFIQETMPPAPATPPKPSPVMPSRAIPSRTIPSLAVANPAVQSAIRQTIQPQPVVNEPTMPTSESIPEASTTVTQARQEAKSTDSASTQTPTISSEASAAAAAANEPDTSDARNLYGALLARALQKYKQYPALAQRRGWEGEVILELQLDGNGNLISSRIYQSSHRDSLDEQALEMAKKAVPFPIPPDSLKGKSFHILVPVSFKLD